MAKISHSSSLTEFQRNAKSLIEGINETHQPLLITVNGRVQAVLLDPVTYEALEEQREKEMFVEGIRLALEEAKKGLGRSPAEVREEIKKRYDL